VAASLAPPGRRASAVGLVMLGLTGATLAGVPIASALGQHFGWRAAFVFVGAIALLAVLLLRRGVPYIPPQPGASAWRELQALRNKHVWLTLGIGAIGFGGMFAVFSYIKPTLTEVAGCRWARAARAGAVRCRHGRRATWWARAWPTSR
jgi:DHA1 family inner membrane transport protein